MSEFQTEEIKPVELEKPVDEESQEERIAWLRSKGVEIDFPEHRKEEDAKAKKAATEPVDPTKIRNVCIVKIPCNESMPLEEIQMSLDVDGHHDQLMDLLKDGFAAKSGADINKKALQEASLKQFSNQSVEISSSTLDKLAISGSVETFPLSRPTAENMQRGVNIYLDESGQLKGLARNKRASALADYCGFENVAFVGDMYVGRILKGSLGMYNEDFHVGEIDSTAPWMKNVKLHNFEFGQATNRVGMSGDTDNEVVQSEAEVEQSGYRFKETLEDVDVTVNDNILPDGITSKDLTVVFMKSSLTVKTKKDKKILLGPLALAGNIIPDECTWSISKSKGTMTLDISLCKAGDGTSSKLWTKLEV